MKRTLIPSIVALVLPIAYATDPPEVKEGLWTVHTVSIDNPGNKKTEGTYSLCRSHAYDKSVQETAKSVKKDCTIDTTAVEGSKYTSELRCKVAGTEIDTKGTGAYEGDTAFHTESHTTYTPALYGMTDGTMIMDQKWVGSCPAGVEPGDRILADGKIVHNSKKK